MTETTPETRTVQQYRHEARRVLTQARETLALRTDATREVYNLLNGSIESILAGRQGLSQEEQVERLDAALAQVSENREKIAEAVERAKAEILAQVEAWDFDAALAQALSVTEEARDFARDRDFEAWQEQKRQRSTVTSYDEDEYDNEDEEY